MLLSEQSGSSCESRKCRAWVRRRVCLVMFFEGTKDVAPCFAVNMYIPAMETFATMCASGLLYLRSKDCRHVASLMLFIWWLCKMPGAGESSISNTPHKSTRVMSTEATVFVLDNHVAHDNSCNTAHHRREGLLEVTLWQSTLAGARKKKQPGLGVCHMLTSLLIFWCCYCCCLSDNWDKILLSGHNAIPLLTACSVPVECVATCLLIGKLLDPSMLHLMPVWTVVLQPCA